MNPSKQIIFLLVGLVIVGTLLFLNNQNVESVRKDVHNKKLSPKQFLLKDKPYILSLDDFSQNAEKFPVNLSSCVNTKRVLVRNVTHNGNTVQKFLHFN